MDCPLNKTCSYKNSCALSNIPEYCSLAKDEWAHLEKEKKVTKEDTPSKKNNFF